MTAGCCWYSRNISDRKQAELQIQQVNEKLVAGLRRHPARLVQRAGNARTRNRRPQPPGGQPDPGAGARARHAAEDLASIRRGALLHDIGKMGIPDSILLKPAA